jgi:hypothetical protein
MAESIRVHSLLSTKTRRFTWSWIFLCELLSMVLLTYSLWNVKLGDWNSLVTLPAALIVVSAFAYLHFVIKSGRMNQGVARVLFTKLSEGEKDVEWQFTDEILEQRTLHTALSFRWELVTKVVELPDGFMIYRRPIASDWIPGDAFDSPINARLFARLAESHAKEYVLIGECRTEELHPVGDALHG